MATPIQRLQLPLLSPLIAHSPFSSDTPLYAYNPPHQADAASLTEIERLPTELLFEVLSYLDYSIIRFVLPLVCRSFRTFTKECLSAFRLVSSTPIDNVIFREDAHPIEFAWEKKPKHAWNVSIWDVVVHPALRLPWDISRCFGADEHPPPAVKPLQPSYISALAALRISNPGASSSNVSVASSVEPPDEGCQLWCGKPPPCMPRARDPYLAKEQRFPQRERGKSSSLLKLPSDTRPDRVPVQSHLISIAHENVTIPAVEKLVVQFYWHEVLVRGSKRGGVTVGDVDHAIWKILAKRVKGNARINTRWRWTADCMDRNATNIWFDGPVRAKDGTLKLVARPYELENIENPNN